MTISRFAPVIISLFSICLLSQFENAGAARGQRIRGARGRVLQKKHDYAKKAPKKFLEDQGIAAEEVKEEEKSFKIKNKKKTDTYLITMEEPDAEEEDKQIEPRPADNTIALPDNGGELEPIIPTDDVEVSEDKEDEEDQEVYVVVKGTDGKEHSICIKGKGCNDVNVINIDEDNNGSIDTTIYIDMNENPSEDRNFINGPNGKKKKKGKSWKDDIFAIDEDSSSKSAKKKKKKEKASDRDQGIAPSKKQKKSKKAKGVSNDQTIAAPAQQADETESEDDQDINISININMNGGDFDSVNTRVTSGDTSVTVETTTTGGTDDGEDKEGNTATQVDVGPTMPATTNNSNDADNAISQPVLVESQSQGEPEFGGLTREEYITNCMAVASGLGSIENDLTKSKFVMTYEVAITQGVILDDVYDQVKKHMQLFAAPNMVGCTEEPSGTTVRNVEIGLPEPEGECSNVQAIASAELGWCVKVAIPIDVYSDGEKPANMPNIIYSSMEDARSKIPTDDGLVGVFSDGDNMIADDATGYGAGTDDDTIADGKKKGKAKGDDNGLFGGDGKTGKARKENRSSKKGESTPTGFVAALNAEPTPTSNNKDAGRISGIVLSVIAVAIAIVILLCRQRCLNSDRDLRNGAIKMSDDMSDIDDDDDNSTFASSNHQIGSMEEPTLYDVKSNDDDTTEVILSSWMKAQEGKKMKGASKNGEEIVFRDDDNNTARHQKNYLCC